MMLPPMCGRPILERKTEPESFGQTAKANGRPCATPPQNMTATNWPRRPLLGYLDEADPNTAEKYIDLASSHGVNVFIYDWYWYDRRPFLEQCLNDGFLQAKNNNKMKFYLMWANHNLTHLLDIRNSQDCETCIWQADVDRKEFEKIARRLIDQYFRHPCYYKIDGKPVFSIYDFGNLKKGLGSMETFETH